MMDLLKVTDEYITLSNELYNNVTMRGGHTYLLQDAHARGIENLGLGHRVDGYERLPHLKIHDLRPHDRPYKTLFLFTGGLGDAISLFILLDALEKEYNIITDVACRDDIYQDIFKPLGFTGDHVQIPVNLEVIKNYTSIQTSADNFFQDNLPKWGKCIIDDLGSAYKVNLNNSTARYSIPEGILKKSVLPSGTNVRIGINFDSRGDIRSYPDTMQPVLINGLLKIGFETFLFGQKRPNIAGLKDIKKTHNYCGHTTVAELASMITQMDIMITMDSFIAHLSNILGKKTLVLLSTTKRGIFQWHKSIHCMESQIECSPCGEVGNECPRKFSQCEAFFHGSIAPEAIISSIIKYSEEYFSNMLQSYAS